MPNVLKPTWFGNPILRENARRLTKSDIASPEVQTLIADMQHTIATKRYGVGLAAPQVGQSVALSVVAIKPTPSRPEAEAVDLVIINPEVVSTSGRRKQMWEGCVSFGGGRDFPYARCLRYPKVRVHYLDKRGTHHEQDFEGLLAHVLQHEIDHLNGVLFVDRIKDLKSFVMVSEYRKRYLPLNQKKQRSNGANH